MISNPYAKKNADVRKRQHRPWESSSVQTDENCGINQRDHSKDDPFDNGIDWNHVAREFEPMLMNHSQQVSSGQDHGRKAGRNIEKESNLNFPRKNDFSCPNESKPSQVADLTRDVCKALAKPLETTINREDVNFPARGVCKALAGPLEASINRDAVNFPDDSKARISTTYQVPQRHSSVSELRPSSWSVNKEISVNNISANVKRETTTTSNDAYGDERQLSLPTSLQFNPKLSEPVQDDKRQSLVKHANLSQPLLNGWTLFPHQKQAILAGLLMRRIILALDMGMGKTLIGCVWSRAFVNSFESLSVVVICPVTLKETWQRSLLECTGLSVGDIDDPDSTSNVFLASWSKIPSPSQVTGTVFKNYVVVADEAHYMQSMQASRTQDALKLMKASPCVGVVLLTGTPMKNGKPSNLFPLLNAVKHPFGNSQRVFEAHFCGGREVNFGHNKKVWQANGSSNLKQLKELTKSHMLHLKKEDCLKNIPALTRIKQNVPVSSRMQMQHDRSLNDMAKLYTSTEIDANNKQERILGSLQSLRVVDSFAKVDAAVQLAQQILKEEPALVVFTSFQKVAKIVYDKLSECGWHAELLTGETPQKKRQQMVDNFQNGLSSAFVCTFGAGGVGLTLTAAHTVILVDRPWTPGDVHQAEDRLRRIGQEKAVKSIWLTAFDLDRQIDEMIEQKSQTSSAVLTEAVDKSRDAPKINIFKLLEKLLNSKTIVTSPSTTSPDSKYRQTSIVEFSQNDRNLNNSPLP